MKLLEDKVIVIGGVGPGMGRALAVRAAAQGARIVMCARTASRLEAIAEEVSAAGGIALPVPSDLNRLDDCERVANAAKERFGRIDGVSMIACMEPDRTRFDDTDDDFGCWKTITNFNLYKTLQLVKSCIKSMPPGGSVAIVSSTSADQGYQLTAPYAAAKAGLAAIVRVLAVEYGAAGLDKRLRFNTLSAGSVPGEPFDQYMREVAEASQMTFEDAYAAAERAQPLGRIPSLAEYADALIFLMSDMSGGINGQNIHVNGGGFMKP